MRRIVLFVFFGIIVLTLQTAVLRFFPIQRFRPDFMLIFTLYLGFSSPPVLGAILSFFTGCFVDLFSGNIFGLYTFSRPALFYGAYLFKSKFYMEGFFSQCIFVFLAAFLEGALLLMFLTLLSPEPPLGFYLPFLLALVPQSLVTALVTPGLFALLQKGSILFAKKNGAGVQERG